ncbi:MAG: sulfatase-like hydrolase/transferase, partial [Thermoplasmata archaeon]
MSSAPRTAPNATGSTRPPNLVTVVLDCARAKNFAHSGGDRIARTPVIDGLAARGTAFRRAVAPANWTVPSHFSFFTGQYPNVHGIRTFQQRTAIPDTTAMFVQRAGFQTAMFTEMVHLVGGYGMEDGFEVRRARRVGISDEERTVANRLLGHARFLYSSRIRSLVSKLPPLITPLTMLNHPQEVAYKQDVCGRYTLDYFEEWMRSRSREQPFYAFFNFVDAHEPYDLVPDGRPVSFLDRMYLQTPRYYLLAVPGLQSHVRWDVLVGGYVRAIEEADAKIGRLLALLESNEELERTMIIVTADHGQSFGEMGNVFHGCGATDSITRVPLVVAPPSGWDLPRRVD